MVLGLLHSQRRGSNMKQPITLRDVSSLNMFQTYQLISTGSSQYAAHCNGFLSFFNMTTIPHGCDRIQHGCYIPVMLSFDRPTSPAPGGAQYDLLHVLLLDLMATGLCVDMCRPCEAPTKIVKSTNMFVPKHNFYIL